MNKISRKVAIIGLGNVGLGTAVTILNQGITDELLLIDRNHKKAEGEAWDLANAIAFFTSQTKVRVASYADLKDVDIICIGASAAPPEGGDRIVELKQNVNIVRSIVRESMDNGFNGIFIIQSNPVDIITYEALKESGLPAHRVIGTGTLLDTGRLRQVISEIAGNIDIRSVYGFSMGEHGNSQAVIWSSIRIGGQPFLKLRESHPEQYAKQSLEELHKKIVDMAWEIIDRKGNTAFGIGAAAARIIRCIFRDEKSIIPISTYLNGEYGQTGIVASVPAIVGQSGMEGIIQIDMTEEEKMNLNHSFDLIRQHSLS
ncbi:MAG: L-lactate dehydrogenase [Brevinema sp.]